MLLLTACATRPPERAADPTPAQWHVPLPHDGAITLMADWWRRLDDPLLVDLIDAAQTESPSIASAAARIADAKAARVATGAAMVPNLIGNLQASRGNTLSAAAPNQPALPVEWFLRALTIGAWPPWRRAQAG